MRLATYLREKIKYAPRIYNAASDRTDHTKDDTARPRKKRIWNAKILRIATWDVISFNNKDQEILIELKPHKIDICAISETKKKAKEIHNLKIIY